MSILYQRARWFPLLLTTIWLLVGTALAHQVDDAGEQLELTLQETVEVALRYNLQVRVSGLDSTISAENIRAARAPFDPTILLNMPSTFRRQTTPQSSQLGGAEVLTNELVAGGFVVSKNFEWGTTSDLRFTASRFGTNNTFSTFNPRFDTALNLNVSQPLLRDFGSRVNRRGILIAQNDFSVSREVFRGRVQDILFDAIQAYWNLGFAFRDLDIGHQNLRLAQEQHHRTQTMVRIGTLARIETVQSEQAVADAELSVIQAEIVLEDAQDSLKRLLNIDELEPRGWQTSLLPVDAPETESTAIDIAAAIASTPPNSESSRSEPAATSRS